MAANTFGELFRLTTFGESHGKAVGGIIDGCPSGQKIDFELIRNELSRRSTNKNSFSSLRNEPDTLQLLSGIENDITTGSPIAFIVCNENQRSKDYIDLQHIFRPSHADYTYFKKYGFNLPGGGRASNRESVSRVVGGAIAKQLLAKKDIFVQAFVSRIGTVVLESVPENNITKKTEASPLRCPDENVTKKMEQLLAEAQEQGDTLGGVIHCIVKGVPVGLGDPVFDKLQADLAKAMMSINASKGFEYGNGFEAATLFGSENNDIFYNENGTIRTKTNRSGGIQGGISNGEKIYFNVAFKPIPTLMQAQQTVDLKGNNKTIEPKGRHDVCAVPRAVPIVEAMAALVVIDHYLRLFGYEAFRS